MVKGVVFEGRILEMLPKNGRRKPGQMPRIANFETMSLLATERIAAQVPPPLLLNSLAFDLEPHAAGSALNHAARRIHVAGVKICHFLRTNFLDLSASHCHDLRLVGNARP